MTRSIRVAAAIATFALVSAACGSGDDDGGAVTTTTVSEETTTVTEGTTSTPGAADDTTTTGSTDASGLPSGPSALHDMFDDEFPPSLVPPGEIISGGPPPDGIPPIDEPFFVEIETADAYLDDAEPVVVLEIDGDARAYPAQVLIWHEIVNDVVGGVPVAVTYCPLCNSAVSYERVVRGVETTFGTSGRLFASALVMYDRATESLWTHFDGRAVVGMLAGDQLEPISSPLMAWGDFKAAFPDGIVLDRDATGYSRRYGTNPYLGYDNPEGNAFLFRGAADPRAAELQRVVGIEREGETVAYLLSLVSSNTEPTTVTPTTIGGDDLVILWKSGQASALDENEIADGRAVGTVGVYLPVADGTTLTFDPAGDGFVDRETSSTWTVAGVATDGPLAGTTLERVPHLDTFWFAWSTYQPGTVLISS